MLHCFRIIYLQARDEYLGDMLMGATLYSANQNESPQTMDPAAWHDWMKGIKIVLNNDSATYDSVELTEEQGYATARQYFIIYCDIGYFDSIGTLRDLLKADSNSSSLARWLNNRWKASLQAVLQENAPENTGHFLTENTKLLYRESFSVMKIFLDDWCQHNTNKLLIQLVQNCRLKKNNNYESPVPDILEPKIWYKWTDAAEQAMKELSSIALTIEVAYKAMPIFLQKYFDQNIDSGVLHLVQMFSIDDHEQFIQKRLGALWLNAVSKVNTEQESTFYNVVTINTCISYENAHKLIIRWFEKYSLMADFLLIFPDLGINELRNKSLKILPQQQRSYLLLNDEITALEAYCIMVQFLTLMKRMQPQFDIEKNCRPQNLLVLLEWLLLIETTIL